jgi:hypothetical protein
VLHWVEGGGRIWRVSHSHTALRTIAASSARGRVCHGELGILPIWWMGIEIVR